MKGIVFEGGGAKGAYQIAAVKALQEMGFCFDAVCGTSVGAINGAAVAQDEISRAYKMWAELEPKKIFNLDEFHESKKDRAAYLKLIKKIIADRGLDTDPLNKIIYDFIDEGKIRKSRIIYGIVTVSVKDLKPFEVYLEDIPQGKLCEYIIASANFPLFKGARIDGIRFSDGGFYNNYPINMLVEKGVSDIVSVRTFGIGKIRKCDLKDSRVTYIEPKEKLGPILDFSRDRIDKNLKLGYFDAYRTIKNLDGSKYYIKGAPTNRELLNRMLSIETSILKALSKDMGIEGADPQRFLFEILIPKIAEYLGLEKDVEYSTIMIQMMEMLAEASCIERFKFYDYDELEANVIKTYKQTNNIEVLENLPTFLTKNDLLTQGTKNKILKEIAIRIIKRA